MLFSFHIVILVFQRVMVFCSLVLAARLQEGWLISKIATRNHGDPGILTICFAWYFTLFFCGYHVFRDVFLVFLFCFSLCFDSQRVFTTLTSHNFSSTGSKLGKILGRVNLSNFILSSVFQPKIWEGNWATTFMKSCEDLICACAQLQTSNGASNPSSFFPWLDMEVS